MPSVQDLAYVSTVQAADALGVSVSTVKRWVDQGVLPAHRTSGGHRKLLRAEVLALARRGELPHADLGVLAAPARRAGAVDVDRMKEALLEAVLGGRGPEVTALFRRAYSFGIALETLADQVIAPVMTRVGHDWEQSRIDVWQEHRASRLCASALYSLMGGLEGRAERGRPVAVGGAPEGDPYELPTLLAQMVLLDAGWEAIQLGPNTPLASFKKALRELQPRLLWLSVSYLEDGSEFLHKYQDLYRQAERQGVAVAVGGQALTENIRATIPYTTHGDGLTHLGAFGRTLHPRPRRPRRGRPRRGS